MNKEINKSIYISSFIYSFILNSLPFVVVVGLWICGISKTFRKRIVLNLQSGDLCNTRKWIH